MKTNRENQKPACLALADGTLFHGFSFGAERTVDNAVVAEVVFNTSMYGYQEILTDPSYAGQMMCFTNPHIGNVGCNKQDVESNSVKVEAVVVRDLSPLVSNYRAEQSLHEYLLQSGKSGIYGIDTRALVRKIRDEGVQMGALACGSNLDTEALVQKAGSLSYEDIDYVKEVSCKEPYQWFELPWSHKENGYTKLAADDLVERPHVVALDCGVKYNILRLLLAHGFRVTVVPADFNARQIQELKPDALFLSNGPGDPAKLDYVVETVKEFIGRLPIFGICLGHQVLAQALGAKTFKLKFGHRGGNQPVRDDLTSKVEITVQNHGYAVEPQSMPASLKLSHINLNDQTVEGLDIPEKKAFSVQYHPESSPGPHDARYLFKRFYEMVVQV